MPPYQRQQPTQITRNLNLIDAKPHADEFLCQMQPQIRDAATTLMRRGAAKGRPAPPARFWPGRSCRWRSYSSKSASILLNIDQNRGAVNPVRYLPHLSWVRKNASVIIPSLRCAATGAPFSSAIEIASGRLFAGRPPAWTLPRRPHRRSPGAKRPLRRGCNRMPERLPQR
jgi:hypothetical protein